jgi:alkylation response protein AidB-like acyl-CoA dehydrogenase
VSDLLSAAEALRPDIVARREEIEAGRRLPPDLAAAIAQAGLFRMLVPARLGGGEVEPASMVAAIEAVSAADGSAGWCLMIGATSGLLAARLPAPFDEEIYGDPLVITGGVFAPRGRARRVDGGYRVTGRWPFTSGCQHCAWLMGGCVVEGADLPEMMLFPADDVRIVDTWSVSGLRGTGSHDMVVDDVFVPAGRHAGLLRSSRREPGALYAMPVFGMLATGIAAVALGIGRAAIDELAALAVAKVATGHSRRLAERSGIQAEVARAEASLRSARAFLLDALAGAWAAATAAAEGGEPVGLRDRALLRVACTNAATSAAAVTTAMYTAGGGTAIYDGSPLQRCFRDAHVATQHMMVAPGTLELAGRVLLGLDAETSQL